MPGLGMMSKKNGVVEFKQKTTSHFIKEWHINNGYCKHCVENLSDLTLEFQAEFQARMHGIRNGSKDEIEYLLNTNQMFVSIGPCIK